MQSIHCRLSAIYAVGGQEQLRRPGSGFQRHREANHKAAVKPFGPAHPVAIAAHLRGLIPFAESAVRPPRIAFRCGLSQNVVHATRPSSLHHLGSRCTYEAPETCQIRHQHSINCRWAPRLTLWNLLSQHCDSEFVHTARGTRLAGKKFETGRLNPLRLAMKNSSRSRRQKSCRRRLMAHGRSYG
jgi:hypothetical protein